MFACVRESVLKNLFLRVRLRCVRLPHRRLRACASAGLCMSARPASARAPLLKVKSTIPSLIMIIASWMPRLCQDETERGTGYEEVIILNDFYD